MRPFKPSTSLLSSFVGLRHWRTCTLVRSRASAVFAGGRPTAGSRYGRVRPRAIRAGKRSCTCVPSLSCVRRLHGYSSLRVNALPAGMRSFAHVRIRRAVYSLRYRRE